MCRTLRLESQSSAGLRMQPYTRAPDLVSPAHPGHPASVPGLWNLGFLLLCGACVWVWVVLGLRFRLRPATPGWGDGVSVCLRARSACTPPFLAGVCAVGVCAWARVSAAPRHSWLGCSGLSVLVCPLRLYPATPGWGVLCGCVCLGSGFSCAPPLLAGVLGCVCACVRTPFVPSLSWLGCALWVCVLGLGFQLRPATPSWGFGVCMCLCARSACTPPLLAGVCGVGVCAWARVSAAPRHSWLGCAVWVCVLGLGFRLLPATPGWGVGVCACLCARSACTPPLLAGVCGVGVCAWARFSAAPRHSWLGCAVWVCVLGLGFRLRPATPGWDVRCGCVCSGSGFGCAPPLLAGVLGCASLCARFACTPPLLAGVCGVGVCAWARFSAAPCHSWLGGWSPPA